MERDICLALDVPVIPQNRRRCAGGMEENAVVWDGPLMIRNGSRISLAELLDNLSIKSTYYVVNISYTN
jgi:hypothetical protein